jgi:rod shape determining protein RodA
VRKSSLFGFDLLLLGSTLTLIVIGILFIYSSGVTSTGVLYSREFIKQMVWAGTGLLVMAVTVWLNYARLKPISPQLYVLGLLLLVVTLVVGRRVHGAKSWLGLGDFGIQPSEFMKISTILMLAAYLSGIGKQIRELPYLALAFAIVLLPMGLILLQPDMGTALVYLPIFLVMTFIAGARGRHLLFFLASGMIMIVFGVLPAFERYVLDRELSVFAAFNSFDLLRYILLALALIALLAAWGTYGFKRTYFYWILYGSSLVLVGLGGALVVMRVLKDYQIMRLIIFLDPKIDPQGAGWNIIQSVTAVGSGGFWGKGFLQGTQSHYRFLPQQSTDFIFSIIAEEWGFFGGILVFALFLTILLRGLRIAYTSRDDFALYICAGILGMVGFHVVVNVGMAMGVMPITGIPLFFLSYGGSSLWTGLIAVGLLLNIHLRRYRH